jgi:hypothetical protein
MIAHELYGGLLAGRMGASTGGEGERKGYGGVKRMEVHCMCTNEDSRMKPRKHCLKERGRGRRQCEYNRGEPAQGTLSVCTELSQCIPLVIHV